MSEMWERPNHAKKSRFKNKIIVPEKRSYICGSSPNSPKRAPGRFQNCGSGMFRKEKELYFWERPKQSETGKKGRFKNYSSRKRRSYIFGSAPNVQKRQVQKLQFRKNRNYIVDNVRKVQKKAGSKIIVSEKRELYFLQCPKRAKKAGSKIIVPEKRELCSWGPKQSETCKKKQLQKITIPLKEELYLFRRLRNVQQ